MNSDRKKIDDAIEALLAVIRKDVNSPTYERIATIMKLSYMKGIYDESASQVGMKRLLEAEE